MNRHLLVATLTLGVNALLAFLGCASPEDRQRRALADEFSHSLGKYKESRVIEVGPPEYCTAAQNGGGELCEWRIDGNSLLYRYDASGIAQYWTYTDRQLGHMEGSQETTQVSTPKKEADTGIWHSVKDVFANMKISSGSSGGGGR